MRRLFFEEGKFSLLLQSNFNRITLAFTQCTYFILLQEVEILKVELEASQRQLEGKDEALRILQSMVGVVQKSFRYLVVKEGKQNESSCHSSSKPPKAKFFPGLQFKALSLQVSTDLASMIYYFFCVELLWLFKKTLLL